MIEFNEKVVYHCANQEDLDALLKELGDLGYTFGKKSPAEMREHLSSYFATYNGVCIRVPDKEGLCHCDRGWYERNKYTIVEYKAEPTTCPECKGTGKYIGFTVIEPCRLCSSK